ncbi:MAG: thymidine phosphorylase family protein [Gammaproteobacteria bacterium]|jgi:thymidine phosphorylase|nr:thymidine phosphorylase family protein [Gammaproteobacteria bacterium]
MNTTHLELKDIDGNLQKLRIKRLGIDTFQEPVIFLQKDSYICRSEGFSAFSRVRISNEKESIVATLNVVTSPIVTTDEIGLSEEAWFLLKASEGEYVTISHTKSVDSFSYVRGKLYNHKFNSKHLYSIVKDIVAGNYTNIHLSAFISACTANQMDIQEMSALTDAMVKTGKTLSWQNEIVMDKHCIGGLPGNRTTPIVVAIVSACGLIMPKTSSRAITSPAGTADTMEVLAPVNLDLATMRKVVEKEGGCIVWGGSVNMSPADDLLIKVERALDIDSEGLMVSSILSKKIAAGSTHVLIDIPVGPTAKARSIEFAKSLSTKLNEVSKNLNMNVRTIFTDGSQPVGKGIGPALEMSDVLSVIQNQPNCPQDLRERALLLAGEILEMGKVAKNNQGLALATQVLSSGKAWQKLQAICEAQGGIREVPIAKYQYEVKANRSGIVTFINNRFIAQLAKLAGAPHNKAAGIALHQHLGRQVNAGDLLFTIHSEAKGELQYALEFLKTHTSEFRIEDELV